MFWARLRPSIFFGRTWGALKGKKEDWDGVFINNGYPKSNAIIWALEIFCIENTFSSSPRLPLI